MALQKSIVNQTDISLSLAKHVISTKAKDDGNLVFSPLSIHVVLGLIAAGSGGSTGDQLLRYLKVESVQDLRSQASQLVTQLFADGAPLGGPRLSFANGVWFDQSLTLKPVYKQIVENDFRSAVNYADFQSKADDARQEVNTWAEKKTSGLIKDLLPFGSVDSLTRVILANAVYFKGAWEKKFNPSFTRNHNFFLLNGSSVQVPFMTIWDDQVPYMIMTSWNDQYISSFDDFKVLSLPYEQGDDKRRFAMHIFLPNARDGLPALVEKVSSKPGFIEDHLPRRKVQVGRFRIPKFKINFGFEASEVLTGQGLVLPFLGSEMVDLTVEVNKIYHKTFIEVNEEGTEAAAATAATGASYSSGWRHVDLFDFVADHPFLFVVREDMTGVVLFVGQVLNPELPENEKGNEKQKRGNENGNKQRKWGNNDNSRKEPQY
ncbi:hypothetical protein CASFOL_038104 [Castilleja foliolosa]|uniref:Serpin domain-containing protein n=1 Tax=Castilleja foliolosa TaxID=1961234 RepID=A0ABD3BK11_9LAMI